MNPLLRRGRAVLACLACLALAAPALAAKAPDAKTLDKYLYNSLRTVINHGVELYNAGRVDDCYDQFRTSLQDLVPVLSGHPDLQKAIREALEKVDSDPQWRVKMAAKATMPNPELAPVVRQKAFALRAVFNDVRTALAPEGAKSPTPAADGGAVDGKVMLDGKPLAKGKVTLSGGGKSFSADVTDGSYKIAKVPAGEYKVAVTGAGVPAKFGDAKTSGMTTTVHKGGNLADLDLKGDKAPPPPPPAETGNVEGTVTVAGKPLAKGDVTFIGKGTTAKGKVDDGVYSVEKLPLGTYTVTVTGAGVPAKYGDAKTSSLSVNVKGGLVKEKLELAGEKKPDETVKPADVGTVEGKVTLNGKPLAKGTVTLMDKLGNKHSGPVAADGTYSIDKVPAGEYKVGIDGGPAKYGDPEKSGLALTVGKGKQVHDIELK